jgi:hypothetical protein
MSMARQPRQAGDNSLYHSSLAYAGSSCDENRHAHRFPSTGRRHRAPSGLLMPTIVHHRRLPAKVWTIEPPLTNPDSCGMLVSSIGLPRR